MSFSNLQLRTLKPSRCCRADGLTSRLLQRELCLPFLLVRTPSREQGVGQWVFDGQGRESLHRLDFSRSPSMRMRKPIVFFIVQMWSVTLLIREKGQSLCFKPSLLDQERVGTCWALYQVTWPATGSGLRSPVFILFTDQIGRKCRVKPIPQNCKPL